MYVLNFESHDHHFQNTGYILVISCFFLCYRIYTANSCHLRAVVLRWYEWPPHTMHKWPNCVHVWGGGGGWGGGFKGFWNSKLEIWFLKQWKTGQYCRALLQNAAIGHLLPVHYMYKENTLIHFYIVSQCFQLHKCSPCLRWPYCWCNFMTSWSCIVLLIELAVLWTRTWKQLQWNAFRKSWYYPWNRK